ncbi:hypothetical protein LDL59_12175 [Kaistella anthropi]|nr:hypothetical protein [Kaistella anthropi]
MKIEESVLDQIRSRPRFKIYTEITHEKYVEILKEFLKNQSEHYTGNINSETATIMVKSDHSSYWKPCLSLRTEHDSEENKTLIRGILGLQAPFGHFLCSFISSEVFYGWFSSRCGLWKDKSIATIFHGHFRRHL